MSDDKLKLTKVRHIPQPDGGRVETGVIQFDGDWAGIFIRGDSALALAFQLKAAARLSELLESCNAHRLIEERNP